MAIEFVNNIHEFNTKDNQAHQEISENRKQETAARSQLNQEEEIRIEDRKVRRNEITEGQVERTGSKSTNILGNMIDVRV